MKSLQKVSWFFGVLLVLLIPSVSSALELRSGDDLVLEEDLSSDTYVAGGNVTVTGNIDGDLVIAGGQVTIEGDVSGDLLLIGGTVNVLGNVGDDVRAAGGNVTLSGEVGDDLVLAGGTVNTLSTVTVGGEVLLAGGQVTMNGEFNSVRVGAGRLVLLGDVAERFIASVEDFVLGGTLAGPVELGVSGVSFREGAEITGEVVDYRAPEEIDFSSVAGDAEVKYTESDRRVEQEVAEKDFRGAFVAARAAATAYSFLVGLITIGLLWWLFSGLLKPVAKSFEKDFGVKILFGFLYLVTTPIALVLVAMTGLGAPFALLGLVLYITSLMVSLPTFTYVTAQSLDARKKWELGGWKKFGLMTLILFVISLVSVIPFVGNFVLFVISIFTIGAVIHTISNRK
jgi:hypothetical protein